MKYTYRLVPKPFIDVLFQEYPKLKDHSEYRALTEYLLFGTYRDERSKKLLLSSEIISSLLGKEKQYKSKHFDTEALLDSYKQVVNETIQWSKYRPPIKQGVWTDTNKRSRILLACDWPLAVTDAVDKLLHGFWKDELMIYFTTLQPYSRRIELRLLEQQRQAALQKMADAKVPVAIDLLELMNNTPNLPFKKLANNINETIVLADELIRSAKSPEKKEELRDELKHLNAFYSNAQPFYKPTDGSVRIFSIGEGLCYLDRRLRKALTKGWFEADLTNSQLAIAAKNWGVEEVQSFLQDGGKIWDHLFGLYGLAKNDDIKRIFKTALYSLMYGAGEKLIKKNWGRESNELDIKLDIKIFFSSSLIQALLRARKEQFELIRKDEGAHDAFNQWLPLEYGYRYSNHIEDNARSVLAAVAQSYELFLLSNIIQEAKEYRNSRDGFMIVLFQHDGFSFIFPSTSEAMQRFWLTHLPGFVETKAKELGIITTLEITKN